MKKKKILIFHQWLAPYRVDQFNALSQLYDLEVTFLFDNLVYDKFNQNALLSQCNFKISYLLKGPQSKSRVFRHGIYKKIKKSQPDIILSYEYSFTTQYLIMLKSLRMINQKLGSLVDDSLDICYHTRSRIRFLARKIALKHLDYLVLLSSEVSQYYKDTFNLKEQQVVISPILQLPEKMRKDEIGLENIAKNYLQKYTLKGKKVLLFVGRIAPEKAIPQFLNNIYKILRDNDNLVFIIVGEGKELDILKSIIEDKKLGDKVIFVGKYEGQELHAWYLCGSGLVLPSISETFGAVVNEALIFGIKVLCSQLAGASSLITPDNGLIFDPLDKNDTEEKMNSFLVEMEPIDDICMAHSPSLMAHHPDDFVKEWMKLTYD